MSVHDLTPDRRELLQSLRLTEAQIQIVRATDKERVRAAAARGALPGSPEQVLAMMTAISMAAPEETLRKEALASAAGLPESTTLSYAESGSNPAILWFLYRAIESAPIRSRIYTNRHTPLPLLADAAKRETASDLLELLAGNQSKMAENPDFPGFLIENPALSSVARARVEEFFMRTFATSLLAKQGFQNEDDPDAAPVELGAAALDTSDLPPELLVHGDPDEDERKFREDHKLSDDDLAPTDSEAEDEDVQTDAEGESPSQPASEQPEGEIKQSLFGQLKNMTIGKKIKLAMMGNMEARKLLVKESNRLIQEAVLKNPRITESEVKVIASDKQTSADMIRVILSKRQLMRKYSMRLTLVKHPKTPTQTAMTFLGQLRDNDLKQIAKSKGIPGNIVKQAKVLLAKKK